MVLTVRGGQRERARVRHRRHRDGNRWRGGRWPPCGSWPGGGGRRVSAGRGRMPVLRLHTVEDDDPGGGPAGGDGTGERDGRAGVPRTPPGSGRGGGQGGGGGRLGAPRGG